MSREVDERVVSMRFDNRQFERGVHTSLGTLEKLKNGLNLDSSAKSLENVNDEVKKFNFSPLSNGLETIKAKFSALEVMGVTALANITNSAVNAGKKIASALIIEPVKSGFQEYETQINATQTILANTQSKGTTLDDVNKALDTLNTYADKTIYNFTEMTRNIGTFTAAGIGLQTSVDAIQGIANLAAVSGSTSQQASTAMYQLSQALAAGTVHLQDWNSVVNAGMGGQVFQDALKETSRAMAKNAKALANMSQSEIEDFKKLNGYTDEQIESMKAYSADVDAIIEQKGSFRESLQAGWITSDVLTETLQKMTMATEGLTDAEVDNMKAMLHSRGYTEKQIEEIFKMGNTATNAATKVKTFTQLWDTLTEAAQSGWTNSWEIIVGDFEEAKELLTSVSDRIGAIIQRSADARNNLLQGWKDDGGRTALVDSLKNSFDALMYVVNDIKTAFHEIFPRTTSKQLVDISNKLKEFTANLKKITGELERDRTLVNAFKGVFSIISVGINVVKTLAKSVWGLLGHFSGLVRVLLDAAGSFGKWLSSVGKATKSLNLLKIIVDTVFGILGKIVDKITEFVKTITQINIFGEALKNISDIFGQITKKITEFAASIKDGFNSSGLNVFSAILLGIYKFFLKIGSVALSVGKTIGNSLGDAFKSGGISAVIDTIFDIVKGGLLSALIAKIGNFVSSLNKTVGGFSDITDNFAGILGGFRDCINSFSQSIKVDSLLKIAKAVAILAVSVFVLATIDEKRLSNAVTGLGVIFAELGAAMKIFGKLNPEFKNVTKTITVMNGMAVAVLILASAVKKFSKLSWEELGKGIAAVAILMGEMLGVTAVLSKIKTKNLKKSAASFIVFGVAINIMATAVGKFANLDWNGIAKGLTGVGGLTAVMLAATAVLSKIKVKNIILSAGSFITFGIALNIMAISAKTFAKLSWEEISKGLTGAGGLVAVMLAATAVLSKIKVKNIILSAGSFIIFGIALNNLAISAKIFSKMDWENLIKGLTGAAGLAGIVIIASAAFSKINAKKVIVGAASALIFANALNTLIISVKAFASMNLGGIAKSLVTMGGCIAILAVGLRAMKGTMAGSAALSLAGFAIATLVPGLIALSHLKIERIATALGTLAGTFVIFGIAAKILSPLAGSMVKIAAAVALLGVGCLTAGVGITALAGGLAAMSVSLVTVVSSLGAIISGLFDSIAESSESISRALVAIVKSVCIAIRETIPTIAETLFMVFLESLKTLKDYLPRIIDTLSDVLIEIMDGLSVKIPDIVKSAVNMLKEFISALDDAIGGDGIKDIFVSLACVSAVMLAFAKAAQIVSDLEHPVKAMGKALIGMGAVVIGLAAVLAALGGLAQIPGVDWLISEGSKLFNLLGNAIGGFVGSIANGLINAAPKDLEQVVNSIASIGSVAAAIAPLTKLLAHIDIKSAAKGIAGFAIIIGGVTAILAALGGLAQIPGFNDIISNGVTVFSAIGNALGAFIGSLVDGIAKAVTSNIEDTIKGIVSAGLLISSLALVTKLVSALHIDPAGTTMGIASLAIAIGGLAVILAALGGLKQIPGFEWIISEGSSVLDKIGNAIGSFIGNIVSGFATGFTSGLPQVGQNMSDFMEKIKPFVEGAKDIDPNIANNVGGLVAAIMAITASNVVESIASFFTGSSSMEKFGESVGKIGSALQEFSDSITGIDTASIQEAASASKYLADAMAIIPKEGGAIEQITGSSNLKNFGDYISSFGEGLKKFSDSSKGVDTQSVKNAAEAAGYLIDVANRIPNDGGLAGWFAGENNIADFGTSIESFGTSLQTFSDNVANVDTEGVEKAAEAAASLVSVANAIPNSGGVAQWFSGEKDLSKFGGQLQNFGASLRIFSDNAEGVDTQSVKDAAEAAASLVNVANTIPNSGGVAQWFSGEKDLSKFGGQLQNFGASLQIFSDNVKGINTKAVATATIATACLVNVAENVPNEGGVAQWFTGEKDLSNFGGQLKSLGKGLKSFSDEVKGVNCNDIETAATATGELIKAANDAPDTGGLVQWFTGEKDLSNIGGQLKGLGEGLKSFSDEVKGINTANVTSAATAAKDLVSAANDAPPEGLVGWFSGSQNLSTIGEQMASFGTSMKEFSDNADGINTDNVNAATSGAEMLATIAAKIPTNVDLGNFGTDILKLGNKLKEFQDAASDVDPSKAIENVNKIVDCAKNISSDTADSLSKFTASLGTAADDGITRFTTAFGDSSANDISRTANNWIGKIIEKIGSGVGDFSNTGKKLIEAFWDGAKQTFSDYCNNFYDAGTNVVAGFANGISDNSKLVINAAEKMAQSALDAVKNKLDINSPSKEFFDLGDYSGQGFVNGIGSYDFQAYDAAASLADSAKDGLATSLSNLTDNIDSEIGNYQPTISPVLDMSQVEEQAEELNTMFTGNRALNLGADISYNNSQAKLQNGGNITSQSSGNTYNFNQNITSPKALDVTTIYRQTRNQFSRMKEVVSRI